MVLAASHGVHRVLTRFQRETIYKGVAIFLVIILASVSYIRLPVWRNSVTLWNDAIAKEPTADRAYFNLSGYYFDRREYDKTIELLLKYVELKPTDFLGYSKLRQTLYLARHYREAVDVCRRLIELQPGSANRYYETGILFEQMNALDSALVYYQGGLAIDSNLTDLCAQTGSVYSKLGNVQEAERLFRKALASNPRQVTALFGMGKLSAARGDTQLAVQFIEEGLKNGKMSKEIAQLLATLYLKLGRVAEASALREKYNL